MTRPKVTEPDLPTDWMTWPDNARRDAEAMTAEGHRMMADARARIGLLDRQAATRALDGSNRDSATVRATLAADRIEFETAVVASTVPPAPAAGSRQSGGRLPAVVVSQQAAGVDRVLDTMLSTSARLGQQAVQAEVDARARAEAQAEVSRARADRQALRDAEAAELAAQTAEAAARAARNHYESSVAAS